MGETRLTGNKTHKGRAYGVHLAECFGMSEAPAHVHRTLRRGILAVTEMRGKVPPKDPTSSLGYDDAYQVIIPLQNVRQEFWQGGRFVSSDPVHAGMTYVIDLRQDPRVLIRNVGCTAHFYMPIATMKAFAEQNDMPRFADFDHFPTDGHDDPVMRRLAEAALEAIAHPHRATGLLLDSILDAACINVLGQYAASDSTAKARPHALAPWQERRAKELMDNHLDVSMSDLAQQCGLSIAHFSRAFKGSTGMAPHRWQLGRRMQRAQALLSASTLSIVEIALECGFSSQSHFTAFFTESTGVSPGRWRRSSLPE